ncbi:MAG: FoF1 ATP synthase subunit a [Chloroflexota bacterium]
MRRITNPLVLLLLGLLALGFVAGPIGAGFLGLDKPTGFIGPPRLHIQVPSESIFHFWKASFEVFSFSLSNTMLTAIASTLLLLFISWRATRRMSLVPRGLQNLMEAGLELILGLVETVAGKEKAKVFLPLVATIFFFILISNWTGLIPGFGTIGVVEKGHEEAFKVLNIGGLKVFYLPFGQEVAEGLVPFFRSANSDVNIPLSMALVSMLIVQYWGIRASGLGNYIQRFVMVKQLFKGRIFYGGIDLAVGALEAISQAAQIISLTFRLFGNIFAGEILLIMIAFLFPLAWILPFFGLELIIGLVQSLIFAMLILIWATLAVTGHEASHEK